MIVNLQERLLKYRSKGILLDSNLLVLLFVGLANPNLVEIFKRTRNQGFTEKEFILLRNILTVFSKIITTPYILAETSNFVCQLKDNNRLNVLQIFTEAVKTFKERRPESKNLVQGTSFLSFGLTDAAILDLPRKKYLVLSVDASLVVALDKKGVDAINFNHLRPVIWQ